MTLDSVVTADMDDVWQYGPGVVVIDGDEVYVYTGRGVMGMMRLVSLRSYEEMLEDDEGFPSGEVIVNMRPELDKLIEHQTRLVLQLVDEGWRDGSKVMDVRDEMEKLELYVKVKKVVEG
jgi:hypothetical protein